MTKVSSNKNFLSILEQGNKFEVQQYLSGFKELSMVKFDKILSIPQTERIQGLVAQPEGYMRVAAAITASLKSAMDSINVRVGLTEDQIITLATEIIEESKEDNLALEDVLLFLKDLVTGKAGKIYDRMDIPTFFELFETYRQTRHEALRDIRYEQSANYKALGPTERAGDNNDREKELHRSALGDHLKKLYKDQVKENQKI